MVDFWAEWCGPCKMIAPILEEIAGEHEGALRVAKLNVDEHPDLARRFDVMSIPTLIVFEDGVAQEATRSVPRARGSCSRSSSNSWPRPPAEARRSPARRSATSSAASTRRRLRARARPSQGVFCAVDRDGGPGLPGRARAARRRRLRRRRPGPRWSRPAGRSATGSCTYRTPMLRGDDVAELQRPRRPAGLRRRPGRRHLRAAHRGGAGRVPAQQRPPPRRDLRLRDAPGRSDRVANRTGDTAVAAVREHEHLRRAAPTLAGRRIVVGEPGGLGGARRAVSTGAPRTPAPGRHRSTSPTPSVQAGAANRFGADVYLGLDRSTDAAVEHRLLRRDGFESVGGRRLADAARTPPWRRCSRRSRPIPGACGCRCCGRPACRRCCARFGPAVTVSERSPRLAEAMAWAVGAWVATPTA